MRSYKVMAIFLVLAMVCSLAGVAAAADEEVYVQGGWEYTLDAEGGAVILSAPATVKNTRCVVIPGELGGAQVVQFGSGTQNVMSNNKIGGSYVLYPEGLRTIAAISHMISTTRSAGPSPLRWPT